MHPPPQWNTPPHGDFAAYVDRLTEQTARAIRARNDLQLDVGFDDPHEARLQAHQIAPPEPVLPRRALDPALARRLFGALVAVLLIANAVFKLPGILLSVLIALAGWVALQALTFAGGARAAALRARLERNIQQAQKTR